MPRTWLQLRVDLLVEGRRPWPDPGRVFIVGPSHTFQGLASAINAAFARWDLAHLHEFRLPDGRRIGYLNEDFEVDCEDHALVKVHRAVTVGDVFEYIFDFGDDWRHRCTVLPDKADPRAEYCGFGALPKEPVAIWGWGTIPDQYGRETFENDDDEY